MKYTAFALSFFSILFLLQGTSCTHANKYPKERQMLDSMQIFIVKADSAVQKIDSAKIAADAKQIEKDDQLIRLAHLDSMSSAATSIFRDFNAVQWKLLTVVGKRGTLLIELEKSKKQLKSLSHDLQHNMVNADSVGYYVAFETKRASELIQVSDMSIEELSQELPIYTALAPKADSLISLLKNHKRF
jgi:hypothetical protein